MTNTMQKPTENDIQNAVLLVRAWFGYLLCGERVTSPKPDGYSLSMGGTGLGFGFEEWAAARCEDALFKLYPKASHRKKIMEMLEEVYWQEVPIEIGFGPKAAMYVQAELARILRAVWRETVACPMPEEFKKPI
jgi:hypothetical protein